REARTHLPVVFEKPGEFLRAPIAELVLGPVFVPDEGQVFRASEIETLNDPCQRSREVGQNIARRGLVVSGQARDDEIVEILHGRTADAKEGLRGEIAVASRRGPVISPFGSGFEGVLALRPADRIAELVGGTDGPARGSSV